MKNAIYIAVSFTTFGLLSAHSSAQVAVSSTFDLSVYVDANTSDSNPAASATYSDSQAGTLNSYFGDIKALDSADGGSVLGHTTASASWLSTAQGSVTVRDTGWSFATTQPGSAEIDRVNPLWTYTFLATSNGTFSMAYNATGTGDTFGLWGANIGWSGPGGGVFVGNAISPADSGVFTAPVVSGTQYTVSINPNSNISFFGGITTDGTWSGTYDWSINPVPEPVSLVALGTGALALLRKRRKA